MVWRTPASVQFGVDVAHVVIDPTSNSVEKAIAVLKSGFSEASLDAVASECGLTRNEFLHFVDSIRPAMVQEENTKDSPEVAIALSGMGFAVESMATALSAIPGLIITLRRDELGTDFRHEGVSSKKSLNVYTRANRIKQSHGQALAISFHHYVSRPEEAGHLLRNAVPQIPVIFSDSEIRIGPVLGIPGGLCAACLYMHQRDVNPQWPAIASQLLGKTAPSYQPFSVLLVTTLLAQYVAVSVSSLRAGSDSLLQLSHNTMVHLNPETGSATHSQWTYHPDCACQELPTNRQSA